MCATDEPVHLAKNLKVGIESENEKCLKFIFKGHISITKANKMSNHEHK